MLSPFDLQTNILTPSSCSCSFLARFFDAGLTAIPRVATTDYSNVQPQELKLSMLVLGAPASKRTGDSSTRNWKIGKGACAPAPLAQSWSGFALLLGQPYWGPLGLPSLPRARPCAAPHQSCPRTACLSRGRRPPRAQQNRDLRGDEQLAVYHHQGWLCSGGCRPRAQRYRTAFTDPGLPLAVRPAPTIPRARFRSRLSARSELSIRASPICLVALPVPVVGPMPSAPPHLLTED